MNSKPMVLVLMLTLLGPIAARADVSDALNGMYMVTGNEPTIYSSQRRLGLDTGYLRLRAPIATFNVVNFSPPQFDAGCGGIDLYGGSFTFINAEQFRQMLRQIGANALGYAFKLALASMCEKCDSILTGLQDKVDALNRMQVDTCKWGAGLSINGAEALGFEVAERYKLQATGAGSFDDTFQAMRDLFENPGNELANGDASGADPTNTEVGNYTWNAFQVSTVSANLSFPAGNIPNEELLMNIAGTFVLRSPAAAEAELGDVEQFVSARLTYDELKDGKDEATGSTNDANPLLTCVGGTQCTVMAPLADWSFTDGVRGWVSGQLQDAADHMANPATASTPHVAALQQFLGSLPFTTMTHMMVMQGNSAALNQYVTLMGPYVTDVYTPNLALQMVRLVRSAYDHADAPDMPPNVKENIQRFEDAAIADLRSAEDQYADVWKAAEEHVARYTRRFGDPGNTIVNRQQ